MSQLMYFLPGLTCQALAPDGRLVRALLQERGIDESLADCERIGPAGDTSAVDLNHQGPGGKSGALLCPTRVVDGGVPDSWPYQPGRQTWVDPFGDGLLWLGWDTASPPTPDALLRRGKIFEGYDVPLAGDQLWKVPVVRRPFPFEGRLTNLTCEVKFDRQGQATKRIARRFESLWDDLGPFLAAVAGTGPDAFEEAEILRLCVRLLAINYRFGQAEQNVLGPLTTTNWRDVLLAATDAFLYIELVNAQKKTSSPTTLASSAIATGSKDETPTTDPATENSAPPRSDA